MKRTLSKGKKLSWKPLKSVAPVKISARDIKGVKIVVPTHKLKKILID